MKAKQIAGIIGTYVLVGAASTAGAALWTNVLEQKVREVKSAITQPKSEKIINFSKAKKKLSR